MPKTPKTSVSAKIIELAELYMNRMDRNITDGKPNVALYWATMVHSLFVLAQAMQPDAQIHRDAFVAMNEYNQRAWTILKDFGPPSELAGANTSDDGMTFAFRSYLEFREQAELMGLF